MTAPKAVRGLIDTGAILALVNAGDRWHERCEDAYRQLGVPLATTAAVLTETFHLIQARTRPHARVAEKAWQLVASDAITVVAIDDSDLPAIEALMTKYADHPMAFADATLVHVAARFSTNTIFTIDHNDFETYRAHGRSFEVTPSRTPRP